MAKLRVHEWLGEDHSDAGMDWEQEAYRAGCAHARELGERRLQTLDDELMHNRPKGLRLVGSRGRTLVTRFGDVTVERRLYRDTDGETVFLLDEYLGWKPPRWWCGPEPRRAGGAAWSGVRDKRRTSEMGAQAARGTREHRI